MTEKRKILEKLNHYSLVAATFRLRKERKAIASIRRLKPAATKIASGFYPS